ncbi:chloride channel protein 2-like isoform X2 [Amphiura filiformis]|uniref:chloride channel protein 2-like isoform X2 n=1 Tax=Amphiura filiformis TaxID=82378 RepID=UPI003B20CA1F
MALQPDKRQLGYEQTLMYGRYTRELGQYAKREAQRLRDEQERRRQLEDDLLKYEERTYWHRSKANFRWFRDWVFTKIGEDWIFLSLLGIIMALLSFAMDYTIAKFQTAHVELFRMLSYSAGLQFLAWVGFPVVFMVFSAGFVHLVSANAIGSGIPEMKTILRGVVLKEYLNFRTLVSKIVGLSTSLGSGLPLGKEGPFVHIASIVSTMLSKMIITFKGIFEDKRMYYSKGQNESRNSEMLAAACAIGVACNFAAPIGGVLFSIEVTSTYFAVRNYWRGFFGSVCGAFVFRLLAVWNKEEETITALFKTNFRIDFPFDVQELVAFSFIGVVCGLGGSLFVYLHRRIVDFNRSHKRWSNFLIKNRLIYPLVVSLVISSITFPLGLGQFMAGELTQKQQINELFSNYTLGNEPEDVNQENIYKPWHRPNVFVTLAVFIVMQFWMTAVSVTLPVPAGVFIPVFTIGAAFGRLVGECMAAWFKEGIRNGDTLNKVIPGGYAVVGAAALSGSVTHTISTSVIVFELTGQITHILPVMIAVLIANAISQLLTPSFYDSIIQIKKLPYLPDISHAGSKTFNIYVEDIMVRNVKFISWLSTYADLQILLDDSMLQSFPLVDAPESMVLLGSVQRVELEYMLDSQIGRARRLLVVKERNQIEDGGGSPAKDKEKVTVVEFHAGSKDNVQQPTAVITANGQELQDLSDLAGSSQMGEEPTIDSVFTYDAQTTEIPKRRKSQYVARALEKFDDMTPEEQREWEAEQLAKQLNFTDCHVDPAPFQLVERTSLHKIHSMFSLLGLNHAYVTTLGRLVGVLALKEIRIAIEKGATYRGSRARSGLSSNTMDSEVSSS